MNANHNEILEKLKKMDDDELRKMIAEVAGAMGVSEGMKRAALSHTGMIRRKLKNATPADIEKAMNTLGKEKTDQILKHIDR